jgi:glycosyltransferase involved in cell wall biosynthesis
MRILRLYPFLPPQPGGMENHVARLSREQRAQGHQVTIGFCEGEPTDSADIRLLGGRAIRSWRPIFLRELVFHTAAALALRRQRGRHDILHVHGDWAAIMFGNLLGKLLAIPVRIFSAHMYLREPWPWPNLYRWLLGDYAAAYATGAQEAAYLAQLMPGRPTLWQPSGIEPPDIPVMNGAATHARRSLVVTVSNLYPVKNLRLVIDIAARTPQADFEIIGEGPERAALEAVCVARGLTNVRLLGHLTKDDVYQKLAAASLFLATARKEGTPTAMLEAMAFGLPIVTSPSNDYRALITPDVNGYILPDWEPEGYVRCLEKILNSEALRATMGAANLTKAQDMFWPKVAERITSLMLACHRRARNQSN